MRDVSMNSLVHNHHPRSALQHLFFLPDAMLESKGDMDHSTSIETYIRQVRVTYERRPYNPTPLEDKILKNAGALVHYEGFISCLIHSTP